MEIKVGAKYRIHKDTIYFKHHAQHIIHVIAFEKINNGRHIKNRQPAYIAQCETCFKPIAFTEMSSPYMEPFYGNLSQS